MKDKIPAIVTTKHRGVFFGYIDEEDAGKDPIKIHEKQMCSTWSSDMHGVFGLAKYGPSKSCRVGPPVKWAIIKDVTSVVACTDEAAKRWKSEPWS